MTTDQAQLRVLGRFELHIGGQPRLVPRQAKRVLALLAVAGSAQPREMVAGTLWGEVTQRRAQANLRNAMWRLRQLSSRVLHGDRDIVALDDAVTLDLTTARRRAHALLHDGTRVDDDDAADVDLLDADLLPAWDEPWLLIEREQQRQLRMHALERLSSALVRSGRYAEAIAAALAAVHAEPLRESSQRALITAHLAEGNVSEAVKQLGEYRTMLRIELGIAPSPALQRMVTGALGTVAGAPRSRTLTVESD